MVHRPQVRTPGIAVKVPPVPHRWRLSPRGAITVQRRLARLVSATPPAIPPRLIAGLDAAFSPDGRQCIAGAVLWDIESRVVVERQVAHRPVSFPYVPGLLSFREAPALLAAIRKLRRTPDALMCDGQGLAHPRRFGIACHMGILCDLPAIGCAKSRLIGEHAPPRPRRGSTAPLRDRGAIIGVALRTQTGVRPIYVSIGHRTDLGGAVAIALVCAPRHRVPEPTRLADLLVAATKRAMFPGA